MHEVPRRTQSCVQHSGHGAGADTRDMVLCDLHISIVKNYLLLIVLITCIQREDAKGAKLIAVSLSVKVEHLALQCRISMSQHKALFGATFDPNLQQWNMQHYPHTDCARHKAPILVLASVYMVCVCVCAGSTPSCRSCRWWQKQATKGSGRLLAKGQSLCAMSLGMWRTCNSL